MNGHDQGNDMVSVLRPPSCYQHGSENQLVLTVWQPRVVHEDLNPPTCCQDDEFHENLIYRGLFRKRSVSLEDTVVSSTTSDPDMAAFQHPRVAAVGTSTGPEDEEEDVDEISEARSAPPVVQHDREDVSEEDPDTMEQEAIQEVLLLLASS